MARGYSGHSELGKEGDLADARILRVVSCRQDACSTRLSED